MHISGLRNTKKKLYGYCGLVLDFSVVYKFKGAVENGDVQFWHPMLIGELVKFRKWRNSTRKPLEWKSRFIDEFSGEKLVYRECVSHKLPQKYSRLESTNDHRTRRQKAEEPAKQSKRNNLIVKQRRFGRSPFVERSLEKYSKQINYYWLY